MKPDVKLSIFLTFLILAIVLGGIIFSIAEFADGEG